MATSGKGDKMIRPLEEPHEPCKTHPQELLRVFCEDCYILVCLICSFGEHKGHKATLATEKRDDIVKDVQALDQRLEKRKKDALQLVKEKEKKQDKIETDFQEAKRRYEADKKKVGKEMDEAKAGVADVESLRKHVGKVDASTTVSGVLSLHKKITRFLGQAGPSFVDVAANSVRVPDHWVRSTEPVHLEPLQPGLQEYKDVKKAFDDTSGRQYTIHKITRVQNKKLYLNFSVAEHQMNEQNPGVKNERHAWHGTTEDVVKEIVRDGFHRMFTSTHMYGKGVYFAEDASYSCSDTYSPPNRFKKHKFLIYSHILTGNMATGKHDFRVPPMKEAGTVRYDSCCNDPSDPGIYVIFSDYQAYPGHIVEFSA